MQLESLLDPVRSIAREAGRAIMGIYTQADHEVSSKDDKSPLTAADLAAHKIIVEGLRALDPHIPVLSEEDANIPWSERSSWQRYWLVDPLDGTKEFIRRNGEFTVNIALIAAGVPVLGVVYAPVLDWMYSGVQGQGASKQTGQELQSIQCAALQEGQSSLRVVASRSHRGEELELWLSAMQARFPEVELVSMGSSLKICLVAEGRADIYPRLAPTCEWDTAAAQAVLEAAGGVVLDPEGKPLRCNSKDSLLNPHFYALGDPGFNFRGA